MEIQRTQNSQNNLQKEQTWRIHTVLFKTYHKLSVIKVVWCWRRDVHTHQWNTTVSPEISQYAYVQKLFDKSAKTVRW